MADQISRVYKLILDPSDIERNIDELIARNKAIRKSLSEFSNANSASFKKASDEIKKLSGNTLTLEGGLKGLREEYDKNGLAIKEFNSELKQTAGTASDIVKLRQEVAKLNNELKQTKAENVGIRKELTAATGKIKDFETRYVKSLKKVNAEAKTLNASFGTIVKSVLASFGIERVLDKIGESLRFVVEAGAGFEKAIDNVVALARASAVETEALSEQALNLGSNTTFTARQAAEAQGILAQAGFGVNEILKATPGVISLAETASLSLAEAADIAASSLRAYGLAASDLNDVNNLLARSVTSANLTAQDFGAAFKFAAPLANNLGLEIERTSAVINTFANAGLRGTVGGTAFRAILTSLVKQSKPAQKALKDLGVETLDSQGNLRNFFDILKDLEEAYPTTTQLAEIFGKNAGAVSILINKGADSLKDYADSLGQIGTVIEGTQEIFEEYGLNFTRLDRSTRELAGAAGDTIRELGTITDDLTLSDADVTGLFQLLLPTNDDVEGARAQVVGFLKQISEPTEQSRAAFRELGIRLADDTAVGARRLTDILPEIIEQTAGLTQSQVAALFGSEDFARSVSTIGELSIDTTGIDTALTNPQLDRLRESLTFDLEIGGVLEGAQALEFLTARLEILNTAEDIAAQKIDNLSGSFVQLLSALEGLAIRVFNVVGDELTILVDTFTDAVSEINQVIDGQISLEEFLGIDSDATDATVAGVAALTAALTAFAAAQLLAIVRGTALRAIRLASLALSPLISGQIASATVLLDLNTAAVTKNQVANSNYVKGLTKVGAAQKAFNLILKAFNLILALNPIGLIIIGIAALAAAAFVAYNRFEEVRIAVAGVLAGINFLWQRAQPLLSALGEFIEDTIVFAFELIKVQTQLLIALWRGLINVAVSIFNGIVEQLEFVRDSIIQFGKAVFDFIKNIATETLTSILELFGFTESEIENILNNISDFFSGLWDGIIDGATQASDGLQNIFKSAFDFILDGAKQFARIVKNFIEDTLKIDLGPLISSFRNAFASLGVVIEETFSFFGDDLSDGLAGAVKQGEDARKRFEQLEKDVQTTVRKIQVLEEDETQDAFSLDQERNDFRETIIKRIDEALEAGEITKEQADDFYNRTLGRLGTEIDNRFEKEIVDSLAKITEKTPNLIEEQEKLLLRVRETTGGPDQADDLLTIPTFDRLIFQIEEKFKKLRSVTDDGGGSGSGSGSGSALKKEVNKLEAEADKLLKKQIELQFEQVEELRKAQIVALIQQEDFQKLDARRQEILLQNINDDIQKVREKLIKEEVAQIKELNRLRNEANLDNVEQTLAQIDNVLARQQRFIQFESDLDEQQLERDAEEELQRQLRIARSTLEEANADKQEIEAEFLRIRVANEEKLANDLLALRRETEAKLDAAQLSTFLSDDLQGSLGISILAANITQDVDRYVSEIQRAVTARDNALAAARTFRDVEGDTAEQLEANRIGRENATAIAERNAKIVEDQKEELIKQVEELKTELDFKLEDKRVEIEIAIDPLVTFDSEIITFRDRVDQFFQSENLEGLDIQVPEDFDEFREFLVNLPNLNLPEVEFQALQDIIEEYTGIPSLEIAVPDNFSDFRDFIASIPNIKLPDVDFEQYQDLVNQFVQLQDIEIAVPTSLGEFQDFLVNNPELNLPEFNFENFRGLVNEIFSSSEFEGIDIPIPQNFQEFKDFLSTVPQLELPEIDFGPYRDILNDLFQSTEVQALEVVIPENLQQFQDFILTNPTLEVPDVDFEDYRDLVAQFYQSASLEGLNIAIPESLKELQELLINTPEFQFPEVATEDEQKLERFNSLVEKYDATYDQFITSINSGEGLDLQQISQFRRELAELAVEIRNLDNDGESIVDLSLGLVDSEAENKAAIDQLNSNRDELVSALDEAKRDVQRATIAFDDAQEELFEADLKESTSANLQAATQRLVAAQDALQEVEGNISELIRENNDADNERIQNTLERQLNEIAFGFEAAILQYNNDVNDIFKRLGDQDFIENTEIQGELTEFFNVFSDNFAQNTDEAVSEINDASKRQQVSLNEFIRSSIQDIERLRDEGVLSPAQFAEESVAIFEEQGIREREIILQNNRRVVALLESRQAALDAFIDQRTAAIRESDLDPAAQAAELLKLQKLAEETQKEFDTRRLAQLKSTLSQIESASAASEERRLAEIDQLQREGVLRFRDAEILRSNIQKQESRVRLDLQIRELQAALTAIDITDARAEEIRKKIEELRKELGEIEPDEDTRTPLSRLIDGIEDVLDSDEFGLLQDSFNQLTDTAFSEIESDIQKQTDAINAQIDAVNERLEQDRESLELSKRVADEKARARNQTEEELDRELAQNELRNQEEIAEAEAKAKKENQILEDKLKDQEARELRLARVREQISAAEAAATATLIALKAAEAVVEAASSSGPLAPIAVAAAIVSIASGLLAVRRLVNSFKQPDPNTFEEGGEIREGDQASRGGMLRGKRHSQGGILIEAEDEEYIINREGTRMFKPIIEFINQQGRNQKKGLKYQTTIPDEILRKSPVTKFTPVVHRTPSLKSQGIRKFVDGGEVFGVEGSRVDFAIAPDSILAKQNKEIIDTLKEVKESITDQKVVLGLNQLEEANERRVRIENRDR